MDWETITLIGLLLILIGGKLLQMIIESGDKLRALEDAERFWEEEEAERKRKEARYSK